MFLWFSVLLCRPLVLLATDPGKLEEFLLSQGAMGRFSFFGIEILQGFLPIPLELTAAAGGYVFGRVQGAALSICSTVISTAAIFSLARLSGHRVIHFFFSPTRAHKLAFSHSKKIRSALTWMIFLIPGTPKRMFIFSAGLVPQRLSSFLFISTLARVPALVACSFGGQALETGDYGQAAAIFLITGIWGIAGAMSWRFVTKRKNHAPSNKNLTL